MIYSLIYSTSMMHGYIWATFPDFTRIIMRTHSITFTLLEFCRESASSLKVSPELVLGVRHGVQ